MKTKKLRAPVLIRKKSTTLFIKLSEIGIIRNQHDEAFEKNTIVFQVGNRLYYSAITMAKAKGIFPDFEDFGKDEKAFLSFLTCR